MVNMVAIIKNNVIENIRKLLFSIPIELTNGPINSISLSLLGSVKTTKKGITEDKDTFT